MRQLKRIIRNTLSLPNKLYNSLQFQYRKVLVGDNFKANGRLYVVSDKPGHIIIGDNVTVNSCLKANPIGGDTKTILFAKENGKIRIGNNCGISNATIVSWNSVEIEDYTFIGGGVKIYDTDFHYLDFADRIHKPGAKTAPVRIKKGAFIGGHSIILKGVTIGEEAIVGAGSVVTKSIPAGEVWGGNPARYIKKQADGKI